MVGLWQKAAKKEGLRFGVSEHLGASYIWFQTNRGADKKGLLAGVPYDGADAKYEELYHKETATDSKGMLTTNPENQQEWLSSIKELIDTYHPDLLYSDGPLPFGDVGLTMLAHYYNQDLVKNKGKLEAVYTPKQPSGGKWV